MDALNTRRFLVDIGHDILVGKMTLAKAQERMSLSELPPAFKSAMWLLPGMATIWASAGFPAVTVGHKLAASMMESSFSPSAVSEVQMPWPSFLIDVPDNLGIPYPWIMVTKMPKREEVVFVGLNLEEGDVLNMTATIPTVAMQADAWLADADKLSEHDRVSLKVLQFILGVCVEMSQKRVREQIRLGPPSTLKESIKRGKPTTWKFHITRDVHVDARPFVRAYLGGHTGRTLGSQSLVRGHYRRQPYGEKMALRRWIFVEPYWRGPDDAPINVRSHIIE